MNQPPSVGRIVHCQDSYRFPGADFVAAIITGVPPGSTGMVDLTAFPPGQPPVPLTMVYFIPDRDIGVLGANGWYWPPRVVTQTPG